MIGDRTVKPSKKSLKTRKKNERAAAAALKRFKALMKMHAGRHQFSGLDE